MAYAVIIPPYFLGELVQLQEKLQKSVVSMVLEAIREYIDRSLTNKDGVLIDGVRYPLPPRVP